MDDGTQDFAVMELDPSPLQLPIFVLSMTTSLRRRMAANALMEQHKLHFLFFDAVDGMHISNEELAAAYDKDANGKSFKRPLSAGEVACALGHRAIWAEIATGPDPLVIVCEDDVSFSSQFVAFAKSLAAHAPAFEGVLIKLDGASRGGHHLGQIGGVQVLFGRRVPHRTTGYVIGRRAAQQLLRNMGPIARPVDIDLKRYWGHGVPVLSTGSPLVSERPDSTSTLAEGRRQMLAQGQLPRALRHIKYQISMTIGRLRHPRRLQDLPYEIVHILAGKP
jgi:glycosyl transferase family 25